MYLDETTPSSETESSHLDEIVSFRPSPDEIKGRSVRGGAVTGLSQGLRFILSMGSTAVLARILSPADFGLVAMTTVLNGFFGIFSNAGLAAATIQRESLTHAQVSNLFWVNTALGCILALLVCIASPGIAWFYNEPNLVPITCAISTTFVFAGLSVQHKALLGRKMKFLALAAVDLVSTLAGVLCGIGMALSGFGFWSLVGLSITTSLAHLIMVRLLLPWNPGSVKKGTGVRPLLKFGGDVLIFDFVNYFSRNFDSILIGRVWGRTTLGLYDKAYSLLMLPINQVNRPLASVAIPGLSRNQGSSRESYFLNLIRVVSMASLPLVTVIALFADEFVLIILGPDWAKCATLFRLLAIGAAARALTNPVGWILVSMGKTERYRRMGIANSVLIVVAFASGIPFGAEGVATAYSAMMLLIFIPMWRYVLKGTGITLPSVLSAQAPAFFSCLIAAAAALGLSLFPAVRETPFYLSLLMSLTLFSIIYAGTLLFGFSQLSLCKAILSEFRPKKSP